MKIHEFFKFSHESFAPLTIMVAVEGSVMQCSNIILSAIGYSVQQMKLFFGFYDNIHILISETNSVIYFPKLLLQVSKEVKPRTVTNEECDIRCPLLSIYSLITVGL
jgi:hypothetical protein